MTTKGKGFPLRLNYTLLSFEGEEGEYNIKEVQFDNLDEAIDTAIRNGMERWQVLETRVVTSVWKESL
jgi:hypothetical protein